MVLGCQFQPASHVSGVFAYQNTDQVFLLLNLFFEIGYGAGGGEHQLFSLAHIEQ